ncbi:MAG: sterol desaturase family protein [Chitinophagales bacterium]|nr:sterol desaturase family protein [Chitinophagales bacterium]MDW8274441.1 sterol desaturase family protein [Chitinophagales bacterium]
MSAVYILLCSIPVFFIAMGLEYYIGRKRNRNLYRLNDTINNLLLGGGQQIANLFYKLFLFVVFVYVYKNFRFFTLPDTWWSLALCIVLYDFIFYWAHRWGHEINIFWGAHVVHHQSEEFNLSVALRQSWFHHLLAFFLFSPMPLLGFSPEIFFAAGAIQTVGQFWIHTQLIGKLHPWIEFIFNTPSHHRVHHSRDPKYIDKNHGGILIIWDRMFGTFKEEETNDEITYGITQPLQSWNPLWANVHYYVSLWNKLSGFKRFSDKIKIWFSRPGWLPDYAGGYQAPQPVDRIKYKKYDQTVNTNLKWYAAFHLGVLSLGLVAYMYHFDELSMFYKIIFAAIIFFSMLIIGGIFENKKWIWVAEYARILLSLFALNSLYWFCYINWFAVMLSFSITLALGCVIWLTVHYLNNRVYYISH